MKLKAIILVLITFEVQAQQFIGAPFAGMGNTGIAQWGLYSISTNAAGLKSLSRPSIALAYQQHFLLADLRTQALLFATPIHSSGYMGFFVHNYGIQSISNELKIGSVYTKTFGPRISTFTGLNYHQYFIRQYSNDHTYSVDIGVQYQWNSLLNIGLIARNINAARFQQDVNARIAQQWGLGLYYILYENIHLSAESLRDELKNIFSRAGISYRIDHVIHLRTGLATLPMQYFAGIGLHFKNLQMDMAASFHSKLGTSPQFAMAYVF